MKTSKVFYYNSHNIEFEADFIQRRYFDKNLSVTKEEFEKNYKFVTSCMSDDLNDIFMFMQGEVWSPNGEARELISALGVGHTSMSVGDIVQTDEGHFIVAQVGFNKLDF